MKIIIILAILLMILSIIMIFADYCFDEYNKFIKYMEDFIYGKKD